MSIPNRNTKTSTKLSNKNMAARANPSPGPVLPRADDVKKSGTNKRLHSGRVSPTIGQTMQNKQHVPNMITLSKQNHAEPKAKLTKTEQEQTGLPENTNMVIKQEENNLSLIHISEPT